MDQKPKNGIELWWGTPIFVYRWPHSGVYNSDLKSFIIENQNSLSKKSDFDIYNPPERLNVDTWPLEGAPVLCDFIKEALHRASLLLNLKVVNEYKSRVICTFAAESQKFIKEKVSVLQSPWSGLYFVDVQKNSSLDNNVISLDFLDPRCGAGACPDPFSIFGSERTFQLEAGDLFLYPSWLVSRKNFFSSQASVSLIAFDIFFPELV